MVIQSFVSRAKGVMSNLWPSSRSKREAVQTMSAVSKEDNKRRFYSSESTTDLKSTGSSDSLAPPISEDDISLTESEALSPLSNYVDSRERMQLSTLNVMTLQKLPEPEAFLQSSASRGREQKTRVACSKIDCVHIPGFRNRRSE
eukprot:TRINITY_DN50066_c0_g1_i1.p1 TRINITY_DN50066_c0_g1~~TRINITY_DN50066_c0_g1_i1.p1  ORF type:complete len:164 (-),score=29.90 TRINITY_DN50066_c0_g1_i1:329-763(-)